MKKLLALILVIAIALAIPVVPQAFASSLDINATAEKLHILGIFDGVGKNADGTTDYGLTKTLTRTESIVLLVKLMGKDAEAKFGNWKTPFTDVTEWAKQYIGYAYEKGLTAGIGNNKFGSDQIISATEYLTLVLKLLGYTSGIDFQWDKAWELSDKIRLEDGLPLTSGNYNANTTTFTRGNVALISFDALRAKNITSGKYLYETLIAQRAFTEEAAKSAGLIYNNGIIEATEVTILPSTATIEKEKSVTLTATVTPTTATDKTVTWSSSNEAIAKVSSSGVVTGVAKGTATITAKTVNGKTATCAITVSDKIDPTGITISRSTASIIAGNSITLTATVTPTNATDKTVTWSSSNEAIAKVSSSGVVTGVAKGTATITAVTSNGKYSSCIVSVVPVASPTNIS